MSRTTRFSILAGLLWAAACGSTDSPTAAPEPSVTTLASLRVPAGFNFATTADVEVNLRLAPYAPAGGAKPRVRVGYPRTAAVWTAWLRDGQRRTAPSPLCCRFPLAGPRPG